VRWSDSKVRVDLSMQAIKNAPAYDSTTQLNREQEAGVYSHYGREGYWSSQRRRFSAAPV